MSRPPRPRAQAAALADEADLLLEFVCWFMTICALPLWMALRGHTLWQFAIFCVGAAFLLAVGSILSGSFPAHGRREQMGLVLSAWLGVAIVGGTVFALGGLLRLMFV